MEKWIIMKTEKNRIFGEWGNVITIFKFLKYCQRDSITVLPYSTTNGFHIVEKLVSNKHLENVLGLHIPTVQAD